MKPLHEWLEAYSESHQNPVNKMVHWICVPLIFFSVIGLLSVVPIPFLANDQTTIVSSLAMLGIFYTLIFYWRMSQPIFKGMALFILICVVAIEALRQLELSVLYISLSVFVGAWIAQFWGHKVEGVKPSFLDDTKFLLIGPAWCMSFLYHKFRIKY